MAPGLALRGNAPAEAGASPARQDSYFFNWLATAWAALAMASWSPR